jgi:hypothetical protein
MGLQALGEPILSGFEGHALWRPLEVGESDVCTDMQPVIRRPRRNDFVDSNMASRWNGRDGRIEAVSTQEGSRETILYELRRSAGSRVCHGDDK